MMRRRPTGTLKLSFVLFGIHGDAVQTAVSVYYCHFSAFIVHFILFYQRFKNKG